MQRQLHFWRRALCFARVLFANFRNSSSPNGE
jgi:hypothetical protein